MHTQQVHFPSAFLMGQSLQPLSSPLYAADCSLMGREERPGQLLLTSKSLCHKARNLRFDRELIGSYCAKALIIKLSFLLQKKRKKKCKTELYNFCSISGAAIGWLSRQLSDV